MERGQSAPQRGGGAGGSTAAAAAAAARLAPKSAREAAAKQADQEVGCWRLLEVPLRISLMPMTLSVAYTMIENLVCYR